ncbi:histidine--tRNA ligase [Buchnera aphidicola]|uniref:histidine--tRNA ligase n=1 Tax=Buchnera aphidicola TaxID=9 RepID=UPI003463C711
MNNFIKSIKGMHDCLPQEVLLWNKIENLFKKILFNYGYSEIRLPILEKTDLFKRTIGNNTDIIGKEMYSFNDKNGISFTLRPEATTSCVRSVIQNHLLHNKKQKLWYYGPMFRYERPQKGRYRQFYQFGIETFGFSELDIELELIMLINRFLKKLGILQYLTLEINSIGSILNRKKYQMVLNDFLKKHQSVLDENSLHKLEKNSLRILDSKNDNIQKLLLQAPKLMDFVDKKNKNKFQELCNHMTDLNISYNINYRLVRGLDYYNDIVFEWKTKYLGSKNTICAGGRYDNLVNLLGGPKTPAIGLAMGMERLLLLLNSCLITSKKKKESDIYIFFSSFLIKNYVYHFTENLRNIASKLKILVEFQPMNFSKILKNLKKYSTKIILFIDEKQLQYGIIKIHHIKKKTFQEIHIDNIFNKINEIFY